MFNPAPESLNESARIAPPPRWWAFPMLLFLFTRIAICGVTYFSLKVDPTLHNAQTPISSNLIIAGLSRWDGGWFVRIVVDGYNVPVNTNFFPLFPMLGRAIVATSGCSPALALVLIANVASLLALLIVYRLFIEVTDGDLDTARLGLSLLLAWPFAFIQAAAYPESLMTLFTASSLWLAIRNRPTSGAVSLGDGILARHLTALAIVGMLAEQIRRRGWHPKRLVLHRHFLSLLIPALFPIGYFVFCYARFGNWHTWLDARSAWGVSAWWGLYHYFTSAYVRSPENTLYLTLSIVPLLGSIYLATRRGPARSLGLFALTLMLLLYTTGLAGLGRYSASCWPAFLGIALLLKPHRGLQQATLVAFAIVQGMALYLWVHLFPFQ